MNKISVGTWDEKMVYLLSLWNGLLVAGRELMTIQPAQELCDE